MYSFYDTKYSYIIALDIKGWILLFQHNNNDVPIYNPLIRASSRHQPKPPPPKPNDEKREI